VLRFENRHDYYNLDDQFKEILNDPTINALVVF